MTIVAIWIDPGDEVLWCAADTRFSKPGPSGTIRYTDKGSKILSLPVVCLGSASDRSGALEPVLKTNWGLAFAGDVAPAMATYSVATILLQNLQRNTGSNDPAPLGLADVARLLSRLGRDYMHSYLSSTSGQYGRFEMALLGWCPKEHGFRTAHLRPTEAIAPELEIADGNPLLDRAPLILGERKGFRDEYERADANWTALRQAGPLRALEAIVARDEGTVGGSVSVAAASKLGFSIYGRVRRTVPGGPGTLASFNGFPLESNVRVGNCFISISLIPEFGDR